MDGNSTIGNVTSIIMQSVDSLGDTVQTTINRLYFYPNPDATYNQVDTAIRALISLSANTYKDTICVTNISVSEVLAG